ncbi:hypothetical protein [Pseudozobellia thermophila]|uniref:TonB protein C-terminal n=1 Tax=Pseudozobellia thermophila TaxID=192903 RepID=A0A1M6MZF2_9FLAO|nr:hypothetical protein [Pseudozobellia thermophila]SHJ88784.1 hypothetical protein SAMN04488513_11175 [Pseudozobellia thermophila]
MRNLITFLLLCFLTGCNWSASREKKTRELVNEEILGIDWDDVDKYPLFEVCDETVDKDEQKACFTKTLLDYLSHSLQRSELVLEEEVADTLYVDFLMDDLGAITLTEIHGAEGTRNFEAVFKNHIQSGLDSLPTIKPALKRGIPVKVKFRVPIVLSPQ